MFVQVILLLFLALGVEEAKQIWESRIDRVKGKAGCGHVYL